MAVNLEWDEKDKRILRFTFIGDWTWEELFEAYRQTNVLLDSVTGIAQVIMDFRQSGRIPLEGMFLKARLIAKQRHDRQGEHIVFIGGNRLIESSLERLKSLYPRIMPSHIYFADSLEDARRILKDTG